MNVIEICKKNISHNNKYEFEFIVNSILKSIYLKNYNKTIYQIKNKIPITICDKDFIYNVKNNENLFDKSNDIDYKKKIENDLKIKLKSDQNIVTRFIYKNLGENKDEIPSDVINNIIKNAFANFNSFWTLKKNGKYCNMTKFIDKNGLFLLPYFCRSFVKNDNNLRLTVGKYVAKNYIEITKRYNSICINPDESTEYKKYIEKNYLIKIKEKEKINKSKNFVLNINGELFYIPKDNENIINGYYVNLELPHKLKDKNLKLININPLYNGLYFKANYVYDVNEIKNKENKTKELSQNYFLIFSIFLFKHKNII